MPFLDRQLARDQRGLLFVPIIQDLQQITPVFRRHRSHAPVIQYHYVHPTVSDQQFAIAAVALGDGQVAEQARQSQIKGRQALTAGLLGQGAGDERFSHTRRTGQQQVVMFGDPFA